MKIRHTLAAALALALTLAPSLRLAAQMSEVPHAPPRGDEGDGPFQRLIVRGATLVDGTGAPPVGPVDIVIEGSRIVEVRSVGAPGVPIREGRRPTGATKELDAQGMYVLPGFVDVHAHTGGLAQGTPAEYVYKLWLAHGVTTIRDPGSGNGVDWELQAREKSAKNEIVAPHIYVYAFVGTGWDGGPVTTPEKAREYVRWAAQKGVDGMKLIPGTYPVSNDPAVIAAVIDEANKLHLGTMAHLSQQAVSRINALDAARMGLGSMEHYYGLPEALFDDKTVQDFPYDYNYNNEYDRFGQAGRLWKQAAKPGSKKWNDVMDEMLKLHFTIDPTMTIYEASRDVMRARRAEWHDMYTLPSLWQFYQPSRESHGSYWYHWTTQDEIEWKKDFKLWMAFLNEYKNRGGRVTTGSDSGFIYKLYGFGYIRELELLQEAGFHPLEVVRSATMHGAQLLAEQQGETADFGTVEAGKRADLVITEYNPIEDFKVLYGTGTLRLNDQTGKVERVGGVRWTIKDGIVYDARQLLDDVAKMVRDAKVKAGMAPDAPLTVVKELPRR
ncbi:MAG: amidohydrolase family protein [Gemmatimonadetes bacterium]|nr:amidohydrolase family protein [Gemmatimonadota bacterium]